MIMQEAGCRNSQGGDRPVKGKRRGVVQGVPSNKGLEPWRGEEGGEEGGGTC